MEDDRDPLLEVLKETGAPCPRCGYDLRGVRSRACPECGAAFEAKHLFGGRRGASGAVFAMAVALSACLPVSWLTWQRLLVRGTVLYGDDRFLNPPPTTPAFVLGSTRSIAWWEHLLAIASTGFWLAVPLLVGVVLLGRGWLERLRPWQRWTLAGGCTVAALLAYRRWMFWYWWWLRSGNWPPYDVWYLRG